MTWRDAASPALSDSVVVVLPLPPLFSARPPTQFDELTGKSNGGWVGWIAVPDLILGINCSIFAVPVIKFTMNASNVARFIVHVETVLRYMIPWCVPKEQSTRMQRREQLQAQVRDLCIIDFAPRTAAAGLPMGQDEDEDPESGDEHDGSSVDSAEELPVPELEHDDPFRVAPTPAEYGALRRLRQNAGLIESR
eukprot:1049983-Rhodomonas_salina.1